MPTSAIRLKCTVISGLQEFRKGGDDRRDWLLQSRWSCAGRSGKNRSPSPGAARSRPVADDDRPLLRNGPARLRGNGIRTKLPTLGVTVRPKPGQFGRQPGQPLLVVGQPALSTCARSRMAAAPAAIAMELTLKGAAHPIDGGR